MNRDEVIRKLQEIAQQHGDKPLTEKDIRKGGLSPYWYVKYFGDVGSALKAVGLQPSRHSVSTATTNDDLLDYLDDLQRRLGRQPRCRDIAIDGRFTERLISIRFGSLQDALSRLKKRQVPVTERPGLPEQSILVLEDLNVQSQSFAKDMLQAALKHERLWQQRLQDAENRAGELERENRKLREESQTGRASKVSVAVGSVLREWAESRRNLRLIHERKSEYVMEIDIPMQLTKEERRLKEQIEEAEQQLEELALRR